MVEIFAFPIPVDAALSPWLAPVFGLMAVTATAVVLWQAVRYLRNTDDRDDSGDDNLGDGPGR